ncbi:MAG: hypothetical protein ACOY3L_09725 [Pseudomonadota bacterium]
MAMTIVHEGQTFDPDAITKIEIRPSKDVQIGVFIFLQGETAPRFFTFPDKAAAIAFCQKIWSLRSTESPLDDLTQDLTADKRF